MPSYPLAYYAATVNAAVGVIAGVLASAYLTVHPSWLTSDVAATAGIVVLVSGGLAASILPPLTRTPGSRESKYLAASAGEMPKDLKEKFPVVAVADPATDPLPTGAVVAQEPPG